MARVMSPDFLKKCQMQPIFQDQWQIAKFILEFKSTHPTGTICDGIKIGWIFSLLKDLFHNVFASSVFHMGTSINFIINFLNLELLNWGFRIADCCLLVGWMPPDVNCTNTEFLGDSDLCFTPFPHVFFHKFCHCLFDLGR